MAIYVWTDYMSAIGHRKAAGASSRALCLRAVVNLNFCMALAAATATGCREPPPAAAEALVPEPAAPVAAAKKTSLEPAGMPVVLLNEDVQETPGKAMISQDLLVSGEVTEANLRKLLVARHDELAMRTGFKFRTGPNALYLAAYASPEHYHAKEGQWVAMLTQSPMDRAPEIMFRMAEFEASKAPPVDKFGKTEADRKSLFRDIVWRGRWSTRDAEEQIPTPIPGKAGYSQAAFGRALKAQAGLGAKLREEYLNRLAKMNGLKRSQLDAIRVEGLQKDWPMP